jgi:hypothetical protein
MISTNLNIDSLAATAPTLGRFISQPRNSLGTSFQRVMDGVSGVVRATTQIAGVDGDYAGLLSQQIELQQQMLKVSLVSNVERTRHETSMSAVRNMRVA